MDGEAHRLARSGQRLFRPVGLVSLRGGACLGRAARAPAPAGRGLRLGGTSLRLGACGTRQPVDAGGECGPESRVGRQPGLIGRGAGQGDPPGSLLFTESPRGEAGRLADVGGGGCGGQDGQGPGPPAGPREPRMELPPDPPGTGRAGSTSRRVDGMGDLEECRDRSRAASNANTSSRVVSISRYSPGRVGRSLP